MILCVFVVNKFKHTDAKTLKSALFHICSFEVLCAAKMSLVDDVVNINLESILPHIPRRRDGDGRLQKEVDDLMLIITCLDEHKAIDKLPKYASESPDNMPSLRLYEGDLHGIVKMLSALGNKVEKYGTMIAMLSRDMQEVQSRIALPWQPRPAQDTCLCPVSYTHLTLPTKRIV